LTAFDGQEGFNTIMGIVSGEDIDEAVHTWGGSIIMEITTVFMNLDIVIPNDLSASCMTAFYGIF
jgi:hypothetical protein